MMHTTLDEREQQIKGLRLQVSSLMRERTGAVRKEINYLEGHEQYLRKELEQTLGDLKAKRKQLEEVRVLSGHEHEGLINRPSLGISTSGASILLRCVPAAKIEVPSNNANTITHATRYARRSSQLWRRLATASADLIRWRRLAVTFKKLSVQICTRSAIA